MSRYKSGCKAAVMHLTLMGLVLGIAGTSYAASFEAVDVDSDGWSLDINASINSVGRNQLRLRNGASRDYSFKVYLDRPIVSMRVTSPSGRVEFFGVFNLETLARRYVNSHIESDEDSIFDGQQVHHIIENLTATVKAADNLFVSGGLGTVAIMQPSGKLVSQNSLQDEVHQLRERLFVEVAYVLDNGTSVQMSVFDGTQQRAVDLANSFGIKDFASFEKMSGSRLVDSASVGIKLDQPLGNTGIHASLGYALVRNRMNRGGEDHMVSLGLDATYELGEWLFYGLVQFVHVFGEFQNLSSVLSEISAQKGKFTGYAQVEYTEVPSSSSSNENVLRATLGARYTLVETKNMKLSPLAEIYVQDSKARGTDLGLILGTSVELGKRIEFSRKSE
jgi:hypothetical protein